MAKTLSNIGISESYTVEAAHVSQSVDAFTGIDAYDISLSGSFNLTGSLTVDGLSTTTQTDVLTFNNTSNQVFYTSSNGFLAPLSSSLVTTIDNVSSSLVTTIDNVSSSIIITINDVSASLSSSIAGSDTNMASDNLTLDSNRTQDLNGFDFVFASASSNMFSIGSTSGITVNQDQEDKNFRIFTQGSSRTFTVDAGTDRIGIGKNNPSSILDVLGDVITTGSLIATGSLIVNGSSHEINGDLEISGSGARQTVIYGDSNTGVVVSGSGLFVGPAINGNAQISLYVNDDTSYSSICQFARVGADAANSGRGRMILKDTASAKVAGIQVEFNAGGIRDSFIGAGGLLIGTSYEYGNSSSLLLELDADSAGKPTTTTWTVTSDERLKTNIVTASLDICYNGIKNIPLKRFEYVEGFTKEPLHDQHQIGWVAQDVEAEFPKAVTTSSFTTWVTYTGSAPITGSARGPEGEVKMLYPGERYQDVLAGSTVINDRKSLDSDQILKMMYGAIQKLQLKVEALEAQISGSA